MVPNSLKMAGMFTVCSVHTTVRVWSVLVHVFRKSDFEYCNFTISVSDNISGYVSKSKDAARSLFFSICSSLECKKKSLCWYQNWLARDVINVYGEGRGVRCNSRDSGCVTSLLDLPAAPNSNLLKSQEFWSSLDPSIFFGAT